jgi:hypothetical protein
MMSETVGIAQVFMELFIHNITKLCFVVFMSAAVLGISYYVNLFLKIYYSIK